MAGTATSIGGPPLAILYQHHHPGVLRPTLAAYFAIGAALSLVGLGVAGQLDSGVALLAAAALADPRARRSRCPSPSAVAFRVRLIRAAVLVVCAASAVALLVRSVI